MVGTDLDSEGVRKLASDLKVGLTWLMAKLKELRDAKNDAARKQAAGGTKR